MFVQIGYSSGYGDCIGIGTVTYLKNYNAGVAIVSSPTAWVLVVWCGGECQCAGCGVNAKQI